MGKKKKRKLEPTGPQAWCFYCNRTFSDEAILVSHQKASHFKCTNCSKRFTNAAALTVHLQQVHKITLEKVPKALPGREAVTYEVSGMRGLPYDHEAVVERIKKDPLLGMGGIAGVSSAAVTAFTQGTQALAAPVFGTPAPPPLVPPLGIPPPLSLFHKKSSSTFENTEKNVNGNIQTLNSTIEFKKPDVNAKDLESFAANLQDSEKHNLEGLVYRDENISPEERRAALQKYRFDEDNLKQQLSSLDADIGARLSQYMNG